MRLQTIAIVVIVLGLCYLPVAWLLDQATGVTGYEMQSLFPEDERPASIEDWGLTKDDPIGDLLGAYGTPGPSVLTTGEPYRFVFVPAERIVETEVGTLVVFDRTANEEMLQARSMFNIAWLLTAADVFGGLVLLVVARLRMARQRVESAP